MSTENRAKELNFQKWLMNNDIQFVENPQGIVTTYAPGTSKELYKIHVNADIAQEVSTGKRIIGLEKIKRTLTDLDATSSVREAFIDRVNKVRSPQCLVAAIKLPTGAIETITNVSNIHGKISYYLEAYDSDFKLKNNDQVQIVDFLLV